MSVSNALFSKSFLISRSNCVNTASWPGSMANAFSMCINSSYLVKRNCNHLLALSEENLFNGCRHYCNNDNAFLTLLQTRVLNSNISKYIIGKPRSSTTLATSKEEVVDDQAPKLTKGTANNLVLKLTNEERTTLLNTLQQFESEQLKAEYKGQLAAFRWRTKLGRPSKVPRLGDVDPTGSYCPVPEDWLLKKYAETIPKPTGPQLFAVAVHNAVPFIGFGFLDNFLMIICGRSIGVTIGCLLGMIPLLFMNKETEKKDTDTPETREP